MEKKNLQNLRQSSLTASMLCGHTDKIQTLLYTSIFSFPLRKWFFFFFNILTDQLLLLIEIIVYNIQ